MSAGIALLETFRLAWPWVLMLLVVPWLLAVLAPARRFDASPVAGLRLPFASALWARNDGISGEDPSAPIPGENRGLSPVSLLLGAGYVLLVLAAARPQWLDEGWQRPGAGRDLLLLLDVSASMQTPDLKSGAATLTRLQAASQLGRRFLNRRPGDRAGLIVFGSRPYLYTPLTYDLRAVGTALDAAAAGLAGPETALGDAVGLAVRTLAGDTAAAPRPLGKVAILISDGVSNRGALSPQQAAWLAAQRGVRVHALGIGAEPDEAMRLLAEQGGGHYARATDAAAVAAFFARVEALEPVTAAQPSGGRAGIWRDLYPLPLAAALLLLFAGWAGPFRRSRS